MDLRSASLQIVTKELTPFFELAIERHPQVIDIRVKRGNPVTVRDYARRILIRAKKEGIGKFTAEQVKALKPRLRIFYCGQGIAIAGIKQKYSTPARFDNYKIPFEVMPVDDARWTVMAIEPTLDEIASLVRLIIRKVFDGPVELRTKLTMSEIKKSLVDHEKRIQIFKAGRTIMLWPKKNP